jgi:ribosomal protein L11 methyltransferase
MCLVAESDWLEIKMTVDGELAEAVSEVLARYTVNGVVVESDVKYNDAEDEGTPYGPVRIFGYIAADEKVEDTRQKIAEALFYLGQIQPLPEPEFRFIANQNWMEAWKDKYNPIPIGKRLLILPAWIKESEGGRIVVKIDPSMAFGTGTHPTTQLCLAMLEKYQQPGVNVVDVGCGSGILSIAAKKLGSPHVLAVDIDPESVKATHENAESNNTLNGLEIGAGSVAEINSGKFSIKQAPLVVVNILAPIILRLYDQGLSSLVAPEGLLILSGILDEQADSVIQRSEKEGYRLLEKALIKDWVVLVFQKNS